MLWVDQHRPKNLQSLSYHPEITTRLTSLSATPQTLPHLLIYGPSGAGKKTRITALLRALYGASADRLRLDKRVFTTPTKKTVELSMICSNFHIELNPSEVGLSDRFVVQEVIKEMAANRNLAGGLVSASNTKSKSTGGGSGNGGKPTYKVVVLTEVDKLSRQAQAALRRTMEKYTASCRLILCCNNQSKVIDPVRSRCLGIRVGAPSEDDICHVLHQVAEKEKITLSEDFSIRIARESSRNLRRAILMLECSRVQAGGGATPHTLTSQGQSIPKTDWEQYIAELAKNLIQEQSPQRLMSCREKLYELLMNCIPPSIIIKTLTMELLKCLDDSIKLEVVEAAAFYEHRIALGSKEIFHLEAFLAKFMAIYKKYLNDMFA